MSMSDPIADALTRLRNASRAGHENVELIANKTVESILKILKEEGYIGTFARSGEKGNYGCKVELKYYKGKPVMRGVQRVSKPGRRIYFGSTDIGPIRNNIGLSIYSTSKGVISGKEAKSIGVGGEYICKVW